MYTTEKSISADELEMKSAPRKLQINLTNAVPLQQVCARMIWASNIGSNRKETQHLSKNKREKSTINKSLKNH